MKGLQRLSLLPVGAEEGKTHEHTLYYIYILHCQIAKETQ